MKKTKTWIITGASRGFGLEISKAVLASGDKVTATVRSRPEELAAKLDHHSNLHVAILDINDELQAMQVAAETVEKYGSIDVLANNAGFGLLGGVYKRQWLDAVKAGRAVKADGLLKLAEETYRKGFETDWRDPYPGVNAVTLRAVRGKTDDDFQELLYMVRYSVRQRLKQGTPEYWDYASDHQLSIIAGDRDRASDALQGLLIRAKERFETSTTLEGLQLLRPWCLERGQSAWLAEIESEVAEVLQDS